MSESQADFPMHMNFKNFLVATIFLVWLSGCNKSNETTKNEENSSEQKFSTQLKYAKNLEIVQGEGFTKARVIEPFKGAQNSLEYYFVPRNRELPEAVNGIVVRTPVSRMVCTSTTFLPSLEMLEETESLVGFPSTEYISSKAIIERVKSGEIVDLGRDSNINIELLFDLDPEVVLTYTIAGLSSNYDQISKSGIPVLLGTGYLEETPLGRAEWIKFIALFFEKELAADSVFSQIENNYMQVVNAVDSIQERPTVFTSSVYKDVWYMPGGDSWAGKYFNAAKAEYLWRDSPESGSMELSFEAVYDKAAEADLWIGTNNYNSLSSIGQADNRYENFMAFKNEKVYGFTKRITPSGANDYFESGIARPDVVLKDIVKIVHPKLFPEYELYFYEKLKK
ncbi:MAG: ABC transporter substrate-binding protein [Bacteroidota bacterium]